MPERQGRGGRGLQSCSPGECEILADLTAFEILNSSHYGRCELVAAPRHTRRLLPYGSSWSSVRAECPGRRPGQPPYFFRPGVCESSLAAADRWAPIELNERSTRPADEAAFAPACLVLRAIRITSFRPLRRDRKSGAIAVPIRGSDPTVLVSTGSPIAYAIGLPGSCHRCRRQRS